MPVVKLNDPDETADKPGGLAELRQGYDHDIVIS